MEPRPRSAFWASNFVKNWMELRFDAMAVDVAAAQTATEAQAAAMADAAEAAAAELEDGTAEGAAPATLATLCAAAAAGLCLPPPLHPSLRRRRFASVPLIPILHPCRRGGGEGGSHRLLCRHCRTRFGPLVGAR